MSRDKKLKELLNKKDYEEALKNGPYSSLSGWFVEILDKSLSELTNFDLIRCIRQNIFKKEITFEIIQRMLDSKTALYADFESVEIMEKLSSVEGELLNEYNNEMNIIFKDIENQIQSFNMWIDEEEIKEYRNYINKVKKKLESV